MSADQTASPTPRAGDVARLAPKTRTLRCKDARGASRRLCDSVLPDSYKEDQVTNDAFEITASETDLNDDGIGELIVWESSWAGTGGGGLWFVSPEGERYKILFEARAGAWTPILILQTKHHGWRDVAYFQTGGGLEPAFVTVAHNGKSYVDRRSVNRDQPPGHVLIDKRWKQTVFGPTN